MKKVIINVDFTGFSNRIMAIYINWYSYGEILYVHIAIQIMDLLTITLEFVVNAQF